jgi:hypothetical protein
LKNENNSTATVENISDTRPVTDEHLQPARGIQYEGKFKTVQCWMSERIRLSYSKVSSILTRIFITFLQRQEA